MLYNLLRTHFLYLFVPFGDLRWLRLIPLFAAILFRNFAHPMMDCSPDLLVIGHSFVRRLQETLMRLTDPPLAICADLGVSAQYSTGFFHGIGGLKLDGLVRYITFR